MTADPARLAWTQIMFVRQVQDLAVTIVQSDEAPSPEYIVLIVGGPLGFSEVARCARSERGALATVVNKAELIADVLEIAECGWAPSTNVVRAPAPTQIFSASLAYVARPEWKVVEVALKALQRAQRLHIADPSPDHEAALEAARTVFLRAYADLPVMPSTANEGRTA